MIVDLTEESRWDWRVGGSKSESADEDDDEEDDFGLSFVVEDSDVDSADGEPVTEASLSLTWLVSEVILFKSVWDS